jgi:hypothetical protein
MVRLSEQVPRGGGAERKWYVQNVRYTTNRLFYLLPREDRRDVVGRVPNLEELAAVRGAMRALAEGDASHVIRFAGPTVAMVGRVWTTTQPNAIRLDMASVTTSPERHAVYTLWLLGALQPDVKWAAQREGLGERSFAQFCADIRPAKRAFSKFSYMDEMQSLHMTAAESAGAKLRSRHSVHEEIADDFDLFS